MSQPRCEALRCEGHHGPEDPSEFRREVYWPLQGLGRAGRKIPRIVYVIRVRSSLLWANLDERITIKGSGFRSVLLNE